MEELRSTEVLDKEIRADSRKKAARIIDGAKEESQRLLEEVEIRIRDAQQAELQLQQKKLDTFKRNLSASLPLEKQRYCVKFISERIIEELNGWFSSIGEEGRLKIIDAMIQDVLPVLSGRQADVFVQGMDIPQVKKMLEKKQGLSVGEVGETSPSMESEKVPLFEFHQGVILKARDGSVTCRLTLDEKVRSLLDEKNYELASSLFGGRLPE